MDKCKKCGMELGNYGINAYAGVCYKHLTKTEKAKAVESSKELPYPVPIIKVKYVSTQKRRNEGKNNE
jgi:hypothetical protein